MKENTQNPTEQTPPKSSKFPKFLKFFIYFILILTIIVGALVAYTNFTKINIPGLPSIPVSSNSEFEIKKFKSEAEFTQYLASQSNYAYGSLFSTARAIDTMEAGNFGTTGNLTMAAPVADKTQRVSDTNVQVQGIDEPDIVKTDGKNIFYSNPQLLYYAEPILLEQETSERTTNIVPPKNYGGTNIINAFPVSELENLGSIEDYGNLLVSNDQLIIFANDKIIAYNMSNPQSPTKSWEYEIQNNNYLVTSRLYNNKLYLVTRTYSNRTPCPMPVFGGTRQVQIACTDIYYPNVNSGSDSVYTAIIMDPSTGQINNQVSLVGSANQSVIYMSTDNLYITYSYVSDLVGYMYNFALENENLFKEEVVAKLAKLQTYDISDQSKLTELYIILQNITYGMTDDEQIKFESELQDAMADYSKSHARDLQKTGIVRIPLDSFKIEATGEVPGTLLNQFSLDEYNSYLRIATSTSGRLFSSGTESFNDLYILDSKLNINGKIENLGLGERIYSARFIGNKGYLVTFKQIDPFYVFDLKDPKNPIKAGELKIPGYSSYLHPLADNLILGVGEENNKVKLSLFNVSDPGNPTEIDKYNMDEYWTEVGNNHHAFLQDEKYQVFFLPSSKGGYVFSYAGNQLTLSQAIADTGIQRALYLNDYLYMVSRDKITVLNEKDWTTVAELDL